MCAGGGVLPFLPGLPGWTCMATLASSGRVAPHQNRPSVQARGASLLPLDQCDMHLGQCRPVCVQEDTGKNNIIEGSPYGSKAPLSPEAPPKAYSLTYNRLVWRLVGSQLGASPEPEPLGIGGSGHLRPCTSMPCLTLWLRTCPFGRGGGGAPPSPSPGGLRRLLLRPALFGRRPPPHPQGGTCSRRWCPVAQLH